MSYSIKIFHPSVRLFFEQGKELDEFEHPPFSQAVIDVFVQKLFKYGYSNELTSPDCREFAKSVDGCPVQVAIFSSEIAFSVPYWNNSQEAIFEALQDASELVESECMVLFNQQEGTWS